MAQNITLLGANYPDVPAVTLPITGGGTATFSDTRSVTYNLSGGASASVTPSEVVAGQGFSVKLKVPTGYSLSGVTVTMGGVDITSQVFTPDEAGGGGTPSATQHTIYFEFSDSTNTTITAYWDDSFISNSITATTPTTYGGKTVTLAQLDGVTWYSHDLSWETLYDGIPDFYTDAGNYFWIASLANVHPTVGSEWRLTIDGTVYYSTAKQSGTDVVIGNPVNCGGTDDGSNVPVAFYNYISRGWTGDTLTFTTGGHSVKIERKTS